MHIFTHQAEAARVRKQFDVGAATVDTILKIHLISAARSQKGTLFCMLLNCSKEKNKAELTVEPEARL